MAGLDRAGLIELLERLGADNDAAVLEAARALHRKAAEAGISWDELIRPDVERADGSGDDVSAAEDSAVDPDAAETQRLIDRILRRDLSDDLRADVVEMKRNLAEGSLDTMDRRYLRALARRLGV
jgi:hypothetical protein